MRVFHQFLVSLSGMNDAPIGIFDSGVGGLTVARSVLEQLPHERIIYIGDTAHLPYGSKSIDEVRAYAFAIMDALIARDVKLLVIACNTATSAVMEEAQRRYSVPIIGVIDPAAQIAAAVTRNGKVGVIATEATVRSGAYNRALSLYPGVEVTSQNQGIDFSFLQRKQIFLDLLNHI